MAATYTQFARNALCLGKTFLPSNHFLRTIALPAAPAPLNNVNLIELAVAITQFAGLGFFVQSGMARILSGSSLLNSSKSSLSSIDRLAVHHKDENEISLGHSDENRHEKKKNSPLSYTILRQFLLNKRDTASSTKIVGLCHFFIAITFFVLFTNTLHFKVPGHPKTVINAVILLEVGLAYMLTTVYQSGKDNYLNYKNIQKLITLLKQKLNNNENISSLSNQKFMEIASSTGFVDNLMEIYSFSNSNFVPSCSDCEDSIKHDLKSISDGLNDKISVNNSTNNLLKDLYNKLNEYYFNFVVTSLFFLLNFIAGYGYLLIILDFYFPEASLKGKGFFNMLVKLLMFNRDGETASFWGGVAGDAAWTIEPLLDLSLPHLRKTFMKRRSYDEKKTN